MGHRERESTHPVDRCMLHPPLPGLTGKGTIRLKVGGPVRTGDQHSAQLGTVHMVDKTPEISDSIPTDKYPVAKLYDPLYFDHEQDDMDPFRYTDLAYSHETAAYRLLCPLEGTVIPRYYGTSRSIRLILIEQVPGISMQCLNPTNYTQSERQNILKAIVDAESMLYTHDILHRDIHPRNVLVLDSAPRRVVLIDFGYCGIGRTPSNSPAEWKAKYLPGVPISPLLRWDQGWGNHANFHEWIDWDWQTWLEHCYESTRASITEHMRSIWLPKIPYGPWSGLEYRCMRFAQLSMVYVVSFSTGYVKRGGPVVPPSFWDNCRGSRLLIINQTRVPSARHPTILTATLPAYLPAHEADGIRAATSTDPSAREASDLAHLGRPGEDQAGGSRLSLSEEKKCRYLSEVDLTCLTSQSSAKGTAPKWNILYYFYVDSNRPNPGSEVSRVMRRNSDHNYAILVTLINPKKESCPGASYGFHLCTTGPIYHQFRHRVLLPAVSP
ncbi:hypothetical protein PABG_11062 [Paracoccidioides brasiliensis Pb03]|nr:hypothetical protein PABG_11062 [Paracoccidioides brasiliensis Pb03]